MSYSWLMMPDGGSKPYTKRTEQGRDDSVGGVLRDAVVVQAIYTVSYCHTQTDKVI